MRRELCVVALAGLLVLAGCSSAVTPGGAGADTPTEDGTPATATVVGGTGGTGSGTVNFYVSDERNAIGDFEHLNVTVETVSFRRVGDDSEGDGESGTSDPTETPDDEGDGDGAEDGGDNGVNDGETATPESGETPEPTETPDEEAGDREEDDGEGSDESDESDDGEEGDAGEGDGEEGDGEEGDGEWITREVNATTVDLTQLQGENATMLSRFDLPNGTYTVVRLHVAEVDGTLTSGEEVNVKLPSERLRLKERFTVGDGEEVDFVFDATVFKAGKSGKYILKPVASESGTDVPIREVAREDGREGSLGARFLGTVRPGEAATVKITSDGGPVSGATVEVDDRTYETGSDGTVMFDVPADAEELEVAVEYGEAEAELKRTFGGDSDAADDDRRESSGGGQQGGSGDDQRTDSGDGTSEPDGTDTA